MLDEGSEGSAEPGCWLEGEPDGDEEGSGAVDGEGVDGTPGAEGTEAVEPPGDAVGDGAGEDVGEGMPALPPDSPVLVDGLGAEGGPPEEFVLQPAAISRMATSGTSVMGVFIA